MTTTDSLSERERQALEHMRKAQELGTSLKEYAAKLRDAVLRLSR